MLDRMNGVKRTAYASDINMSYEGKTVTVAGFAARKRNLGNLIFIDLRDRTGIVQLAFDDKTDRAVFEKAESVHSEYVLMATGNVIERESKNYDISSGEVEIDVTELKILSAAETPPFEVVPDSNAGEDLRLKYRYLDLRRPDVAYNIIMRSKIVKAARDYYDANGFIDIETPTLIKSTPEGARDYLVPSRLHHGTFYALPQSPQLYKQLLMISGFDRYIQIARCYRDEDLRADRQPEFTQIDLEMSFIEEDDIMVLNEGFIKYVFDSVLGINIETPFLRLTYEEGMERFGSDKPDMRFGMELCDLSDELRNTEFKVFSGAIAAGGSVKCINAKGLASVLSRKEIDKLAEYIKSYRARGLAFLRLTDETGSSSYEKFLSDEEKAAVRRKSGAEVGDVILIVADAKKSVVYDSLGALRCEIARNHGLIKKGEYKFLWITDFPLFEFSEEENRYMAMHHPFTAPKDSDLGIIESDPGHAHAKAYDMVLNGSEIGGGSIRINDPEIQDRMFHALGFTEECAQAQFGFLINAFRYGAPPHGGMAFGLDRLVMEMLQTASIRDVIAFPKVQSAVELMSACPTSVDPIQLEELGIGFTDKEKE